MRAARWAVCLVVVALALAPGVALGAPEAEGGHGGDDATSKIWDPALDLTLWSIVDFLALVFILTKFAWKPILQGLQKREEAIQGAVEEARHLREEMGRERAEFQKQLASAHQEIPKLMEEARREGEQLKEELRGQALAEIQAERQRLRREIGTARDQALQEIWNQTANLATLISARVIGRTLSEDDHRRLVDEALDEARNRGTADGGRADWLQQARGKA